jgi:protein SCO1
MTQSIKTLVAHRLLCLPLLLWACGCKPTATPPAEPANHTYAVRGVVQALPADLRHATIKHEAIPGYMAAMTMDFSVRDNNVLAGITPGDEITFNLVVTADDDWIEHVQRVGKKNLATASGPPGWHLAEPELEAGDPLPEAEFTSELGQKIHFADYKGQALAFTFFFTSCPLPEYCPRMNQHFAAARRLLVADTSGPTNWQLLSLSFDPAIDQPQVLANYAGVYRGLNPNHWLFAVANSNTLAKLAGPLDFRYWRDNGVLSHNLRTLVVDTHGKIYKQFDGNDWTAEQLAAALRAAATNAP